MAVRLAAGATIASGGVVSGAVGGQSLTLTVVSGAYASADVADGLAITSPVFGLAGANNASKPGNYSLPGSIGATGNITKKPVTVTAAVLTKVYDGSTAAAGATIASGGVVSGAVGAQSLTLTVVSGTYASADVADGLAITSPVFGLMGADNASKPGNYSLSGTIGATGNITPLATT